MQLKSTELIRLLPPNMQTLRDKILCKVIDVSHQRIAYYAEQVAIYSTIENADEMVLDHLAYQRKSDLYELNMDLLTKRSVVLNTPTWHKMKGTAAAVEDVVSKIFNSAVVKEWYEAGLEPNRFIVETTDNLSSSKKIDEVKVAINKVKRFTSHLSQVNVNREIKKSTPIRVGLYRHKIITIGGE